MSANRLQFRRCQKFQRYLCRRCVNVSENTAALIWISLFRGKVPRQTGEANRENQKTMELEAVDGATRAQPAELPAEANTFRLRHGIAQQGKSPAVGDELGNRDDWRRIASDVCGAAIRVVRPGARPRLLSGNARTLPPARLCEIIEWSDGPH